MSHPLPYALYPAGIFSVLLGLLHFWFPRWFDFRGAIPERGEALKPFPLIVGAYPTTRQDIYGLVWVMNHAASFAILTVGLLDLTWTLWLPSAYGPYIAVWIALFWFLRAITQLKMGRREGDWWILAGFAGLGLIHLLALVPY